MSPTAGHISSPDSPVQHQYYRNTSPSSQTDRNDFAIHKHRKMASTGGGRAWTEEEESYLLRTRLHKMPYKHIAAHLRKTELACRLHYHQMSYGSNRRKRTGSMSSTTSSASHTPISAIRDSSPEHTPYTHLSPVASPPSSPESVASQPVSYTLSHSPQRAHVPILPKPTPSPPQFPTAPADLNKSLRLDTSFAMPSQPAHHYAHVIDHTRLRSLYATHRKSFWSIIAAEYGSNQPLSAHQLEEAFFHYQSASTSSANVRGASPPTPGASPQDNINTPSFSAPVAVELKGFSAINAATPTAVQTSAVSAPSPGERCAVSALLTVEREVRAPREEVATIVE